LRFPPRPKKGLIELIEHLIAKAVEKYNKTTQKVIHELIVPRGVAAWNSAAERGDVVMLDAAKF
jgi:hypothetical protein